MFLITYSVWWNSCRCHSNAVYKRWTFFKVLLQEEVTLCVPWFRGSDVCGVHSFDVPDCLPRHLCSNILRLNCLKICTFFSYNFWSYGGIYKSRVLRAVVFMHKWNFYVHLSYWINVLRFRCIPQNSTATIIVDFLVYLHPYTPHIRSHHHGNTGRFLSGIFTGCFSVTRSTKSNAPISDSVEMDV